MVETADVDDGQELDLVDESTQPAGVELLPRSSSEYPIYAIVDLGDLGHG